MNNKINLKARVSRHSRVFRKKNFINKKATGYNFVLFIIIFLIPIYPRLSSFANQNATIDFYRGNIDESSILGVYYGNPKDADLIPILESKDSFLSVSTSLNDSRNLLGTNEVILHEVKSGESFGFIANKFNVSINSILWANNFSSNKVLQPGDKVKVPPVSGILHKVKSGDTLLAIANKYKIDINSILEQNLLSSKSVLKAGETIIIPGAIKKKKIIAQIKRSPIKSTVSKKKSTPHKKKSSYSFVKGASSSYIAKTGKYKLVWRKPFSGQWGNCTYYVASYKNVNWRGNANRWMRNAKAKGHKTGSSPSIGAIVQFSGRGYNPRYGHVGIVMDIKGSYIIVSDMNYRRLNEVTYRKILINDVTIDGYIYVK